MSVVTWVVPPDRVIVEWGSHYADMPSSSSSTPSSAGRSLHVNLFLLNVHKILLVKRVFFFVFFFWSLFRGKFLRFFKAQSDISIKINMNWTIEWAQISIRFIGDYLINGVVITVI